jgi:fumarylacetoacetase
VTLGFGTVRRDGERRLGFRSGDAVVDLGPGSLDELLPQGREAWERVTWEAVAAAEFGDRSFGVDEIEVELPFTVADYVDFYSSLEHATNLGRMFRPDAEPLLPNWRHLPVGYHGRAGTVVVSGTPVHRPQGQSKQPDAEGPVFGPSRRLDLELELGFVVGVPSVLGEPVPTSAFRDHVFGVVLVNDWSARDIQRREMKLSMGPVKGKDFATTLGPWLTTPDELEPARKGRAYDLAMTASVNGRGYSRASLAEIYWSFGEMVAYASRGTRVEPGDVIGSGTCGTGCILELSMVHGEDEYPWLAEGDEVTLEVEGLGSITNRVTSSPPLRPLRPKGGAG